VKSIDFEGIIGSRKITVQLLQPFGGGDHWQILIDKYYQGTMTKANGEWVAHLGGRSDLTGDEVAILGTIIDRQYPDKPISPAS
jgi:hypothetical protein